MRAKFKAEGSQIANSSILTYVKCVPINQFILIYTPYTVYDIRYIIYPNVKFGPNYHREYATHNMSQLKNPDTFGAPYTFRIQYWYTQTQCEDGARDFRVL